MYPIFESIKIADRKIFHFDQHLARMQDTAMALWHKPLEFGNLENDLKKIVSPGLHKVRVEYNAQSYKIESSAYKKRHINQLMIITDNEIDYTFKFTNRTCFKQYTASLPPTSDILILKNGKLSDSSFSNIACWNGHEWHTPSTPLFYGMQRKLLLAKGLILEKEITREAISQYQKISLINAMLDLRDLEISIANIQFTS